MIEVSVTQEMIDKAKLKDKEMGTLNNSIRNGAGNLVGFIGEQVALSIMGGSWSNTYDYDLVTKDGKKVDVKTKQTTVPPLSYYECSVAKFNTSQNCDAYAFVRVKNTLDTAWFLGVMDKQEYYKKATPLKKGDVDPSNNFTVRADCYNLKIEELNLP
jgi:hypothetical protein